MPHRSPPAPNLDTVLKLRKLFARLVAAVAAVLLILTIFVVHALNQSRLRYYAAAEETSRNLSVALENFLLSHFQEVDLSMQRAAQEFRAMQASGHFDDAAFSAYLRTLKERTPHARSVRGSNADGLVIYGEEVDPTHPQDLNIREFFQRARAERELIFGVPVKSRITGEWVLPLMYALTKPDGSFGGTAYVNMSTSRITELFASLNTGPHGVISLLDSRRRLLHRYPEAPGVVIGAPARLSAATEAVLASGKAHATYQAESRLDGQWRVYNVERIGNYPVYVLVGLSSDDFLIPWHREIRNASIFLAVMYLLAGAFLASVRVAMRKQYQSLTQLVEKDAALQSSLARLTASESRWRSLTEGLPQMVWTTTPALRLDFLSHHWDAYTGVPTAQLLAREHWSAIVHPDDGPALESAWRQAQANGHEFRCDCRLRRHDGQWRLFDHHALAQRDANGVVLSWVGSSTDITEARAAHDALLLAKEQALQAGRTKSEFLANMSHEIRSPMNAVLGMLQLLQQTALDGRQHDYASKAETAARALLGLLNDILDFSKVEAGKLALDPHPFSLDKLWRDLGVILSANVGDKNVEVLFSIDPALPSWVVGDALRLQQILLNLAGNAIKFTASGEVVLSAKLAGRGERGLAIAFAVSDTGIGISAEHCQHIFDGFSQAEASTARRYGGTGLGLAISQRLTRIMGGTLRVESTLGQGSVFSFVIELQPAAEPAELAGISGSGPATVALADIQSLHDLDCLVVDDNASARQILRDIAHSFGWRVDVVDNGYDALAAVAGRDAEHPYDVVFVDWRMPALDGWETSWQIRRLVPEGKTPLIVMVTAYDRELLAQRQAELEPVLDGVLVKPVTASMMFNVVADARLSQHGPAANVAPRSLQRLAGLRLLLVEDNPTNQQVASELLGNDGADVEVAGCGQAAIDTLLRSGQRPDLILMDIQMPDMDGYEATRQIRARLGELAPPIVAMTANAMPADRAAALAAGMVDHIGKPFDLSQLIAVILRHARPDAAAGANTDAAGDSASASTPVSASASASTSTSAATSASGQGATVSAAPAAQLNSTAALARMGGLAPVYLMALHSFAVEAERSAAALREAVDGRRLDTAPALLHTLKGLSGTVGAEALAALAAQAEAILRGTADPVVCAAEIEAVLAALPATAAAVAQLAQRMATPADGHAV
ncbi:response regulator [Rugamonas apoptosis]|uniref:Sensory/regulatory protein RpfC n=1 Tax=Rugamonas apoptosis TaxID=2758570 RepID=A0A7W2F8C0_9BURK|nr:response regulator [Rugamonas apoptosis]MBA5686879.1 response regulator [Rugamonas apoptosis]